MANMFQIAPGAPQARENLDGNGLVELSDLKEILLHRRRLVVGTAAVLTLLALIYSLLTAPLYSATAEILIDPRDLQVVTNDLYPNSVAADGGITQVESQVSVVQSTGVLTRAVQATDLTKDPEFNRQGLLSRLLGGGSASSEETALVRTIDAVRKRLSVKRADKVLVISVTMTSTSPTKAARLANAVAQAYLDDQAMARSQTAENTSGALTARLEELRGQVQSAANAVEEYRRQNNLTMASGRLVSEQEMTDLNNQLTTARGRTAALKSQVDQIRAQRLTGLQSGATSEAIQSAVITQLRNQEAVLEERATSLRAQLGPSHPQMITIQSQLANIQQLITRELDRIAASVNTEYQRALANEQDLATKVASLEGELNSKSQASVRLSELQRDLDSVRTVYEAFLTRAQETREQVTINNANARIITEALTPQKKSWPPVPMLLAGAVFGGLGLGAGLALIAELLAPTLLSPSQAQSALKAPVVGVIPGDRAKKSWLDRLPFARRAKVAEDDEDEPMISPRLDGAIGLALRRILEAGHSTAGKASAASLIVTSCEKDTSERLRIVSLLGVHATSRGERVLVIDANMDQKAGGDRGLLDVLAGECSFTDAMHFQFGQNIAYMRRGRSRKVLREAQGREHAVAMLAQAHRMFDLVVIDGGILSENLRTAPLVASVDHVILVAEKNQTSLRDVADIRQAAELMGQRLSGILLVDRSMRA
ncbi:GumC family protein [Rhizobium sp. SL86]|uniref:GumC family protein n=1 Tax=Rhizobium sp. SL86 TaxID=2995148 RepID=UPI0022741C7B|nr:exopolysaccharide transport family protein [Rhizobium sp. SL86]MCY1666781.1 exopolysaccharide transport family protein [Rhizobium sp. SL86]